MKLETILKAAVSSMIRGHHTPHCYRSWVKGEGYTNDGTNPDTRTDYLAQLERTARNEIDNMGFALHYGEPGYEDPKHGVLFADWNCLPRGLDRILERAGYAIEWSDEWTTCSDCGHAVRIEPDSYCWKPSYVESDNKILCPECAPNDDEDDGETCPSCGCDAPSHEPECPRSGSTDPNEPEKE